MLREREADLHVEIVGLAMDAANAALDNRGVDYDRMQRRLLLLRRAAGDVAASIAALTHPSEAQAERRTPATPEPKAQVFFGTSQLDWWSTSHEILAVTDYGSIGHITVRYTGRLERQVCGSCGKEIVTAAGTVTVLECPHCGESPYGKPEASA